MAVQLAVGSPMAEALNTAVHTKLLEVGWGSEDDTSLAEFIVLMLVNGKTEDQIATELASDILPSGEGTQEFARWLFEQIRSLQNGPPATVQEAAAEQSIPSVPDSTDSRKPSDQSAPAAYDSEMTEGTATGAGNVSVHQTSPSDIQTDFSSPTGPKTFRAGSTASRGSRMMGQVNRAMDRRDSPLHRVRQGPGSDRISHVRDAPKGPRNIQNRPVRPGMQKALNGIGMAGNGMNGNMMGMNPAAQMPMTPQQQMEFMAMMEQGAKLFAGYMPNMMSPNMDSSFQQSNGHQGKPLHERMQAGHKRGRGGRTPHNGTSRHNSVASAATRDTKMDDAEGDVDGAPTSSMETQATDVTKIMCHFNKRCTQPQCRYVHQSPAAPEGTPVDMEDTCQFGARCKNYKCAGKHPSPAQIKAHQAEEQCSFFPYCTKPNCPFKHPSMPMCRNGGDCNTPNCKFTHLTSACKFKPCTKAACPYKHEEGQRGIFSDNVWTPASAKKEGSEHVSERKFVEEGGEEELIKPQEVTAQETGVTS